MFIILLMFIIFEGRKYKKNNSNLFVQGGISQNFLTYNRKFYKKKE